MKKISLPLALLPILLFITSHTAVAITTTTPIYFAKHRTSTTLTGTLSPKQTAKNYHFNAKKGQYMMVELFPKKGTPEFANVGEVITPSGTMQGDKGGIIYQGCLPESGTYSLRIARNLMATQGKTAGYMAKVTILPIKKYKCF